MKRAMSVIIVTTAFVAVEVCAQVKQSDAEISGKEKALIKLLTAFETKPTEAEQQLKVVERQGKLEMSQTFDRAAGKGHS